ncbi:hypothetical protein IWQ49_006740 [Labrenzia sp. EL_126]|nr:hypothetical protein [Labrenzia sp. EL_126]
MPGYDGWRPKKSGSSRVEIAELMEIVFNEPMQSFGWLHRYGGGSTVCSVEMVYGSSYFVGRFDTTGYSEQRTF